MPKFKCEDETTIFFKVLGKGDPIVLISGGFCDHQVWDDVVEPLSCRYQVITYDNRGIGQSDASVYDDYTPKLLASDLNSLLTHLEIQSAHIIGHSMGGFIAQYFAAHYPRKIRSLSLLSSLLTMNIAGNGYLDLLLDDAKNDFDKLQKQMPELAGQSQTIHSILQQAILCKQYDAQSYINKISVPTLIMSGINELVVTKEDSQLLASVIKNVNRITFLNCGHMLQRESPNEVVKELLNFLDNNIG
ncbi:alpha/beta hydrolase [Legionella geestiana]|uniref:Alpha/beta hydrolase n=1 Tax=Legionella geestiana TaxID=45065 RepID=A0A0W0TWL4_9GAMM|nr:alpha/beta hydrolase [Legionella geestiana]KTD00100.1 alpha/beta hydrolase [Legionella geestiana]QBS11362.1 alpha/beta hydrolase [Legionella geestiana]QDQ38914.1 alpha/beta hydrolase [Legionella geestiana]STX53985.1 alpha/beta hydrolase [Legionella geestiana]